MSMSRAEALQMFLAMFPPGYDQVIDLTPGTNAYGVMYATSGAVKAYLSDYVDTLRDEINPLTCTQKLSDWESALGLRDTPIARFGTTAQRRNAVIAWLRQSGSFSLDDIRAAVQPYFLYNNPTQIEIVETDRTILATQHTYLGGTGVSVPANSYVESPITILDDPRTSPASGLVGVNLDCTNVEQLYFRLLTPNRKYCDVLPGALGSGSVIAQDYFLHFNGLGGTPILGDWSLWIGCQGGAGATINAWTLMAEGQGVNFDVSGNRNGEGLGAAMFYFAIVADEDKLGSGYDLIGARRAIKRLKPAHTDCEIVFQPTGALSSYAIPDTRSATPDGAIPA